MTEMIAFCTQMLGALASFLGSVPIIYLFGLVCLTFVVKIFKTIFTIS
jgi:hypothetical protein